MPDSSTNTRVAFRRAAFFYPWPVLLDPGADARLIALDGTSGRLLGREAQAVQQAADMCRVIAHTKLALDQPTHPRAGPQVRGQPRGLRTLQEQASQTGEVASHQATRSTRGGPRRHRLCATLAGRCLPAPNAASIDTDLTGYFNRREALAQQAQGAQTPLFQFLRTSGWTHESPPDHRLGHYLRNDQ